METSSKRFGAAYNVADAEQRLRLRRSYREWVLEGAKAQKAWPLLGLPAPTGLVVILFAWLEGIWSPPLFLAGAVGLAVGVPCFIIAFRREAAWRRENPWRLPEDVNP